MPHKYILNSAVITAPGLYEYKLITARQASAWVYNYKKEWKSTLGYQETADALSIIVEDQIPMNREQITMMPGDEALVFRLTKRIGDPTKKGEVGVNEILANCEIGILWRVK